MARYDLTLPLTDEAVQMLAIGGDALKEDAVVHAAALGKHVVDREGREHPVLYGFFGEHLGIADVVAVSALLLAIDDDAKHVDDIVAVAVEGAAGHGNAAAHLGLHPVLVDLLEGEALVAVDGVDEPDVFSEEGGGFHGILLFF